MENDSQINQSANADIPLYGAVSSFLQFPTTTDIEGNCSDVAITGIPFDMATSGRSGSRFGPQGIRKASANLMWEGKRWPWQFCLNDRLQVIDVGDVPFKHGEPQTLVENLEAQATRILNTDKTLLSFGGDHFVTLPLLRAYAAKYGPVALIHFDAHTDTYSGGSRYDHGTIFHHAVKERLVDTEHSIQIGIRTSYDHQNHPFEVLDAAWINDQGPNEVIKRIKARVGTRQAYVSFDIDGLDPAFAPGTGTPVAAGMSIDCALKVIRGMVGTNLIGMDIVEVAPAYDHAEITSLAAATLALEYLYVVAANKS
ncbi:agmatinase [Motiliproteus sp. MSK22-1]|uniref:agmatinase n=1 Tax=Motiliproteus sp. MSK22-1 TaxID=1897630 RepID=UPI000975DDB6|nr:agmatinase [Motiliproteus sp. MSK22-1]OMH38896.1 agmatinase [Motiliproteus sp. MSK22-1]